MKKKDLLISGVCFLFAVVFLITSLVPRKMKQENHHQETETQVVSSEDNSKLAYQKKENTMVSGKLPESSSEEQEPDIGTEPDYPVYQEGFEVLGVPEELLILVDSDLESLSKSIQETFYQNGFYDYTQAQFLDSAELDYIKNTLMLTFRVKANEDRNITAEYYRNAKEWLIQIW